MDIMMMKIANTSNTLTMPPKSSIQPNTFTRFLDKIVLVYKKDELTLIPRELITNIVNRKRKNVTFKRGNEICQYDSKSADPIIRAASVTE